MSPNKRPDLIVGNVLATAWGKGRLWFAFAERGSKVNAVMVHCPSGETVLPVSTSWFNKSPPVDGVRVLRHDEIPDDVLVRIVNFQLTGELID